MDVVGVSRARTSGSFVTKSGKKAYRGQRKHWYVYYYDDNGKFRKKRITPFEVPYYGSLIRRTKTYLCRSCGFKFRSMRQICPKCGSRGVRVLRSPPVRKPKTTSGGHSEPLTWSYAGTFMVEAAGPGREPPQS